MRDFASSTARFLRSTELVCCAILLSRAFLTVNDGMIVTAFQPLGSVYSISSARSSTSLRSSCCYSYSGKPNSLSPQSRNNKKASSSCQTHWQLHSAATGEQTGDKDTTTSVSLGEGTATIPSHVFNLVKGIVGAGVLTLPAGIATYGNAPSAVWPAVFLIVAIGSLSGYGFALIGRVCALTNTGSYRGAWEQSVSAKSSGYVATAVTMKTLFAILAYSMILGDTFQALAFSAGLTNVSKVVTLASVTTFLLLPLCLLKNLSSLAPFSLMGTLGMVYTAVAMAVRYFGQAYVAPGGAFATDLPATLRPAFGSLGAKGALSAKTAILLGMLSTSYMAHFNAPKFYTELKNNTVPRFLKVVSTSFGISIGLFCIIASLGFLTFGGNSAGLILNNYSTRDGLMGLSRIAVAVSLVFSYPLAFVGARDGVLELFKVKNRSNGVLNTLTVGMLTAITVVALLIPDVSFVLAFAGATLGNCLIYVFPGIMFRGAIRKLPNPTKMQKAEVKVALTSAAVGAAIGILGAIKAVQGIL